MFNDLLKTCNFKTEATGLGKCTMRWFKKRHSFVGLNVIAVYNEEIQDNVFRIDAARIGEKTVYEVMPLECEAVLLKK
ncbi:unknown [Clostridium sp. CAG:921]|nr:unknown [Clostridium sp. CAG:921]